MFEYSFSGIWGRAATLHVASVGDFVGDCRSLREAAPRAGLTQGCTDSCTRTAGWGGGTGKSSQLFIYPRRGIAVEMAMRWLFLGFMLCLEITSNGADGGKTPVVVLFVIFHQHFHCLAKHLRAGPWVQTLGSITPPEACLFARREGGRAWKANPAESIQPKTPFFGLLKSAAAVWVSAQKGPPCSERRHWGYSVFQHSAWMNPFTRIYPISHAFIPIFARFSEWLIATQRKPAAFQVINRTRWLPRPNAPPPPFFFFLL